MMCFQELKRYKTSHGHSNVPHRYSTTDTNVALGQWVKRQRHQYTIKKDGQRSNLTDEREAMLDDIDFSWSSRTSRWDDFFQELCRYKAEHGNCQVGRTDPMYSRLGCWLKRQRRICRQFLSNTQSPDDGGRTGKRVSKLLELGIELNDGRGQARRMTNRHLSQSSS